MGERERERERMTERERGREKEGEMEEGREGGTVLYRIKIWIHNGSLT